MATGNRPPPARIHRHLPGRGWRPTPFLALSIAVHAAFPLALLLAPSHWLVLGAVLIVDHAILVVALLLPRCSLAGSNLTRLPVSDGVALTFDDGPDPEVTPQVLALLDRYRACATFFCIGEKAEQQPQLITDIVDRGHRVENHSQRHRHGFSFLGPRAMVRDIRRCQQVLERLSGRRPRCFRAPAGIRNPWLDPILARLGLILVSWTRRGFDTVERDPRRVAERLLAGGLSGGEILLLHDGDPARDSDGTPVVLPALELVLQEIRQRGLRTALLA